MRSPSVFASLMGAAIGFAPVQASFLQARFSQTRFLQTMAERDALVEHEAYAAPAARLLRHAFEISEDAALEVIDLAKSTVEQIGAGLFASDAAGAEHGNLPVLFGIEMARGIVLEFAEAPDPGIDRAFETAHRHLERIAGVDHQRVGRRHQRIPVGGADIGADPPGRVD